MRTRKNDLILPQLRQSKGKFYISYSCYRPQWDRMVRYKIHSGLMGCTSADQAAEIARPILNEYTLKLKNGWRPWDSEQFHYDDLCDYSAIRNRIGAHRFDSRQIRKCVSEFIKNKRAEVSQKTMESYVSKLRLFCMWLENSEKYRKLKLYQITPEVIHDFFIYLINKRKLDRLTIEKYKINLSQLFKFCVDQGYIKSSPVQKIPKPPKTKDMAARPLSDKHLGLLFRCIEKNDQQFFLACMFQFFLCCRPGNELRLMKIEDVNLSNRTVHIREETGKTGARIITIPEALINVCQNYHLEAYPADNYIFTIRNIPGPVPVGKNYFNRRFREFRDRLNLPNGYKFYSLKHTASGKLLESGATIVEVMSHLGHKDFESTIHYIRRHFGSRSEKISSFRPDVLKGII